MPINAGRKDVQVDFYEYDPGMPTAFTLSLAGLPEVFGEHVANIAFTSMQGVAWTMLNEFDEEVPITNSFGFSSAGETYRLLARGALPVGEDSDELPPIEYSVAAAYAPVWAHLRGEIKATVVRHAADCPPPGSIDTFAPAVDTIIATIPISAMNDAFGGNICEVNAYCGGSEDMEWIATETSVVTGSIIIAGIYADTSFKQRAFSISGILGQTPSLEGMSVSVTHTYLIWKECGTYEVHYQYSSRRAAGTGQILSTDVEGTVVSSDTSTIATVTTKVRVDMVTNVTATFELGGGSLHMNAYQNASLRFVAHPI